MIFWVTLKCCLSLYVEYKTSMKPMKSNMSGALPVDEAVATLDVEPLDSAGDFGGDDFFGLFVLNGAFFVFAAGLFAVGLNDVLDGRAVVCGRCCAVLRVAHDGKMVRLTT